MQTLSKIQIALFTLLSIIDLITTYVIIKAGGSELNPIFAHATWFLIPAKCIAIALIWGISAYIGDKFGDYCGSAVPIGANVLTGCVIIHNLLVLGAI